MLGAAANLLVITDRVHNASGVYPPRQPGWQPEVAKDRFDVRQGGFGQQAHRVRESTSGQHTQRHALTVTQFEFAARLNRMTDRVAKVEKNAHSGLLAGVLFDYSRLDPQVP